MARAGRSNSAAGRRRESLGGMFELINSRLSIGVRSGMIAACAAPPIALLLFLFVANVSQDIRLTDQELSGATYIGEIWVNLLPPGVSSEPAPASASVRADDPRNAKFHTVAEAKTFAAAASVLAMRPVSLLSVR